MDLPTLNYPWTYSITIANKSPHQKRPSPIAYVRATSMNSSDKNISSDKEDYSPRHPSRSPIIPHFLWSPWHRQNHSSKNYRQHHQRPLHRHQCCSCRRKRNQRSDRNRPNPTRLSQSTHNPLCRWSASLQQIPTGCITALGRKLHNYSHRCNYCESLLWSA